MTQYTQPLEPTTPTTDYSLLIPEHLIPKLIWAIEQEDKGPWNESYTSPEMDELNALVNEQLLTQGYNQS